MSRAVCDRAKRATGNLTRRAAVSLDLSEHYFPEARVEFIVDRLGQHTESLDRVYDHLRKTEARAGRPQL